MRQDYCWQYLILFSSVHYLAHVPPEKYLHQVLTHSLLANEMVYQILSIFMITMSLEFPT